jgi:flagellar protein FliO/FliZ
MSKIAKNLEGRRAASGARSTLPHAPLHPAQAAGHLSQRAPGALLGFGPAASALALRAVLAVTGIAFSAVSVAQETSRPFAAPSTMNSAPPSGIASLSQVTLALGLVLAVIFVAAYALRRMRGFGKTGTGALEVVADLAVGQKERAVLIRVGNQQVLIGVAPGRITTLHVLAEPVAVTPPTHGPTGNSGPDTSDRPNFKALLMKSLGK